MANSEIERRSVDTIRTLAMDAVQQANAGHPGTAMALAPLAYLLYTEVMRHNPANPHWADRDRFILSAGHACVLQYSALHLAGYDLPLAELKRFRQWESLTPGHPEVHHTAGIEATTGPLGQGFANGVGFAIAERYLAERYNRPYDEIVDHRVYAICSDGDLMEGVSAEAASIAGQLGLGKLVYFYDDNRITIDGTTSISFSAEDKGARFEAQGWHVQHVDDANDLASLREAIARSAERDRAALADRRPLAHRLRRAARGRHREVARRPARRGRGARDEGGARLGSGRDVRRPRRRARAHERHRARDRARDRLAGQARRLVGAATRRCARTGTRCTPAARAPAGSRRCRSSRPARTWRPATRARR